jgi:hypothetical protein
VFERGRFGVRVGAGEVVGADLDRPRLVDALEDGATPGGIGLCNLPALAVIDGGGLVVDAGDYLIAGGEARPADLDLLRAELPCLSD